MMGVFAEFERAMISSRVPASNALAPKARRSAVRTSNKQPKWPSAKALHFPVSTEAAIILPERIDEPQAQIAEVEPMFLAAMDDGPFDHAPDI
jgi:hypothetical protein